MPAAGLLRWTRDRVQLALGKGQRSGISPTFAARSAALLFVIGGVVDLGTALQPSVPGASAESLVVAGVGAVLTGVVIWHLPWARWSMRATLALVPVALLVVAASNTAGGQNPWEWSLFFLVVYAWIGVSQPPGVSLWVLPLFALAYVVPLFATHQTSALALTSVVYVGIVCALIGEGMAWVSLRWREAESGLSRLMGNLPGMAYKCADDREWTMQFVSAGCEPLTGYSAEALLGNTLLSYSDLVWPADVPQLRHDIQAAIRSDAQWTCTYRIVTASGELRWVWERGLAVKNGGGQLLEGFIQDVTDQHEAEARLTAAAAEWRQTFDAMPDAVAVLDASGIVLRCNTAAAESAGRACEAVIGRHCHEAFHDAHDFIAACPHRRARASGQAESSILQQGERWLRVTLQPVFDAAGSFAGGIEVTSDISELKQAEQRLIDSLAQVQSLSEETIAAIAGIVEVRDPYTAGHQRRVSALAVAIAEQLGLADHRVAGVRVAGMVHDVGKIIVPSEILNKPGRLSEMEFQLIKQHAEAGYEILRGIEFPWPVAEIARQHHERLDGSGYPRELSGEEIVLEARILAVADVVEAMASHRPYRAALGLDAALTEIEGGSGERYDEAVVRACKSVLESGAFSLDEPAHVLTP